MKKGSRFMAFFCTVMLLALLAIVGLWNRVSDFGTACLQTCLFLVVMNWFDGIVIDRPWVGQSRIWRVEGMEGVPYVKPSSGAVWARRSTCSSRCRSPESRC